jgi:hypothetical protein
MVTVPGQSAAKRILQANGSTYSRRSAGFEFLVAVIVKTYAINAINAIHLLESQPKIRKNISLPVAVV